MRKFTPHILLIGLLFLLAGGQAANAQSGKSLHWERYDVTISTINTSANSFDVTEYYVLAIDSGTFRFGTATIPTDRMNGIGNFSVTDGGAQLLLRTCDSLSAGYYCAEQNGSNFDVTYDFVSPAQAGTYRNISLRYTVNGALRSYPGGDQLYWVAVPADKPFPVYDSKVTVNMPADLKPQVIASYPPNWKQAQEGNTITWTAPGNLGTNGSVEVRVQYPHNPAMPVPGWQAGYDRQRTYEETIKPLINLGLLALGVLLALGGPLLVYIYYARHGRDPQVAVVPEYLAEPPSNEPPGVVGALLTEEVQMRQIMATLVDLARRGFLVIEQVPASGLFGHTDFVFHQTDNATSTLRNFETTLLNAIFLGSGEVSLTELRNKFYPNVPILMGQLNRALVTDGFFEQSPQQTRNNWAVLAVFVLGLAALGGFFTFKVNTISPFLFVPFIGLGITGLAMFIAASYMPAKTTKGAQEAARWKAFRTYLQNIRKYADVKQASDQFERFIGYAVAFGMENQWVHQFSDALTAMPTWYYYPQQGMRWRDYYRHNNNNLGGFMQRGPDLSQGMGDLGGRGGLNQMSQSLTEGLNSMSGGLTSMLNQASSVMTSQPSSSGGSGGGFHGGGGGFSGGGHSGGGGSGGGSRGFG